jgi:hypothetical protein
MTFKINTIIKQLRTFRVLRAPRGSGAVKLAASLAELGHFRVNHLVSAVGLCLSRDER